MEPKASLKGLYICQNCTHHKELIIVRRDIMGIGIWPLLN